MSKRCEDVTDRLLELLYDELPADERAALQAHIAGCARCQAEVATFEKTRSLARATLAEPAPAGVRQRLLAAAATASAVAAAAKPMAAERGDSRRGRDRWTWLRQHWTLPTLATVGAMAVFLLASRVFLNPDKTYRRGQEISAPSATAPPPVAVPLAPPVMPRERQRASVTTEASNAQPVEAAHATKRGRLRDSAGLGPLGQDSARPSSGAAGLGSIDQRPQVPRRRKEELKKSVADDDDGALLDRSPEADKPNPFPGVSGGGLHAVGAHPESLAGAVKVRAKQTAEKSGGAAPAPPPAAASQPSPKAAVPSAAAPPAEATESPPARAPAKMEEEAPAVLENLTSRSAAEGGKAADEPLPQKAERLFGQQRWAEAAAAFEQLIRQYPQSPSVPRWRQRLAVAREHTGPRH